MGRFGIGARVRDWQGDLATVIENPKDGTRVVRYDNPLFNQAMSLEKSKMTPIDAPAAQVPTESWVPKVGDRVRVKDADCLRVGMPVGAEGVVTRLSGGEYFQADLTHPRDGVIDQMVSKRDVEPLPVAEQPARLTIEAGKFYRTRDGRKVGPMEEHYGTAWDDKEALLKASIDGDSRLFRATSGIHLFEKTNLDLVAEWVDEPAVAPEATTGEVAQAKFTGKGAPGDVVRCDAWAGTLFKAGREYKFDANGKVTDEHGFAHDIIYAGSWTFLRNEPAAPPAKFKVGDRIKHKTLGYVGKVNKIVDEKYVGTTWDAPVDWSATDPIDVLEPAPAPAGGAPTTLSTNFIVARLTPTGQPRPNARPRIHTTLASAENEAQRLADRLGDEFAVYQRVSVRDVDAGPVPERPKENFERVLAGTLRPVHAFGWSSTKQGWRFWSEQNEALTPAGRAILRKWIAEAEAEQPKVAA